MSESEFIVYLFISVLLIFGMGIYLDRLRLRIRHLEQELEHSEKEREFMSRLLHPSRNKRSA